MHHSEGKNSCCNVIEHDSGALGEFLQLAHRRRLDDVEPSKKYKTGEESFPCQRDGDECDELSGDLVDHNELGVFPARGAGYAGSGGDADEGDEQGQGDGEWGAEFGRQDVRECGPDCDCGYRCPGPGAGVEAADAEGSGRQGCPLRGARAGRRRYSLAPWRPRVLVGWTYFDYDSVGLVAPPSSAAVVRASCPHTQTHFQSCRFAFSGFSAT